MAEGAGGPCVLYIDFPHQPSLRPLLEAAGGCLEVVAGLHPSDVHRVESGEEGFSRWVLLEMTTQTSRDAREMIIPSDAMERWADRGGRVEVRAWEGLQEGEALEAETVARAASHLLALSAADDAGVEGDVLVSARMELGKRMPSAPVGVCASHLLALSAADDVGMEGDVLVSPGIALWNTRRAVGDVGAVVSFLGVFGSR
jgi:hypothetical protein